MHLVLVSIFLKPFFLGVIIQDTNCYALNHRMWKHNVLSFISHSDYVGKHLGHHSFHRLIDHPSVQRLVTSSVTTTLEHATGGRDRDWREWIFEILLKIRLFFQPFTNCFAPCPFFSYVDQFCLRWSVWSVQCQNRTLHRFIFNASTTWSIIP